MSRAKSGRTHRGGAYLVLYGPVGRRTHARLVSLSDQLQVDDDTPEGFARELAQEALRDHRAKTWREM